MRNNLLSFRDLGLNRPLYKSHVDREEGPVGPCRCESVNFVLILKWKDGKPFSKKLLTFEGLGVGLLWPLTVNSTYRRLAFLIHRRKILKLESCLEKLLDSLPFLRKLTIIYVLLEG